MPKYNKSAVDQAIRKTDASAAEAWQIHRILSGRCGKALEVTQIVDIPAKVPGGESAMSKERFIIGLAKLGYNINTANQLLGIGRSTIYRMAKGSAKVPPVIMRLMDMYERYGIPPEHK